jgi:uncharacterized RDD family membrane protein YckC
MMENNIENIQQDLLSDEANSNFHYEHATQGQRFLNFLIDNIVMRFTITYITGYGIGFILAYLFREFMKDFIYDKTSTTTFLIAYLVGIFNYLIYYTLLEKLFKGKTIGKFITGTRALRTDGEELTFKDAFLRSLCRLVPFEVFTGFGVMWHDSWTNTMVVKK